MAQEIVRLARLAYQRELDAALGELYTKFKEWKAETLTCHDLNDLIHEFHDGESRRLWKFYNYTKPDGQVASAVARGIIREDEVPPGILKSLQSKIEAFRPDDE